MSTLKNVIATIMVVIALALVSCENEPIDTVVEETSAVSNEAVDNELNATQGNNVGLLQRRKNLSYSNWIEKDDISNLSSGYTVKDVHNYKDRNSFYFCVLPKYSALKDTEIYLKTYSPSRETVYTLMKYNEKNGRFEYEISFEEDGTYYYRYFVRRYKNKNELTKLHKDSKSFFASQGLPFTINHNHNWEYGAVLGTVNGVEVYCNTGYKVNIDYYKHYQCVEFCKRYYDRVYKKDISGIGDCCAKQWYDNGPGKGLYRYRNGGNTPPQPGDILCYGDGPVYEGNTYGHVAIIMEVKDTYIKIAQQNSGTSSTGPWVPIGGILNRNGNTISPPDSKYTIKGWLRAPNK